MTLGSLVLKTTRPQYLNGMHSRDLEGELLKLKMADGDWIESKGEESSKELKTALF